MILKILLSVVGVLLTVGVGLFLIGYYFIAAPEYEGPKSDHFNGETFTNIGGASSKPFTTVLKWMLSRKQGKWPPFRDIPYGDPPPKAVHNSIRITFINHATTLIQSNGQNILTDPIWSERASPFSWVGPKRNRTPGIRFDDLPPIDYVIISHNHYDHLDISTLKNLEKEHSPHFLTPLGVRKHLLEEGISSITDLDWWDEYPINDSTMITCVPAQHFSGRGIGDRNATLWCGYVIANGSRKIYFAGDTGYGEFLEEIRSKFEDFTICLLPIGAYQPRWFMKPIHMSPAEAVKAHLFLRSARSIPIHYGTFPLADDAFNDPVKYLEKALQQIDLGNTVFEVIPEGSAITAE